MTPPANLTYGHNPAVYIIGVPIEENAASSSGGAIAAFTVAPPLPPGLLLNSITGAITGTPAAITDPTDYTIVGSNTAGVTSITLRVTVSDIPPANLFYPTNPVVYTGGRNITPNVPTCGGGVVLGYSVLPALPSGLRLDPSTGTISGAPLELSDSTYTVTASNWGGRTQTTLALRVVPPPPPTIAVQPASQLAGPGLTATFTLVAEGWGPLAIRWRRDGVAIPGAESQGRDVANASYTTSAVTFEDSRSSYSAVISDNFGGSVGSDAATLTVEGFVHTGTMSEARSSHTATLLRSGRVLVVGGGGAAPLATAEIFDETTGTWSPTGALSTARADHAATLLPSGNVLVVGGADGAGAEVFDEATGTWSATGPMVIAGRRGATATLLGSGKVLVAGGHLDSGGPPGTSISTVELYDPATGTWSAAAPLGHAREKHVAALLPSGKVLVAGGAEFRTPGRNTGYDVATSELYDSSNAWTAIFGGPDRYACAALLPSGRVLAAGGVVVAYPVSGGTQAASDVFVFDEAIGVWSRTASLAEPSVYHTVTTLPSGMVLRIGGPGGGHVSAELFGETASAWSPSGPLQTPRYLHTATLLPSGRVLVAGGVSGQGPTASAEIWTARP